MCCGNEYFDETKYSSPSHCRCWIPGQEKSHSGTHRMQVQLQEQNAQKHIRTPCYFLGAPLYLQANFIVAQSERALGCARSRSAHPPPLLRSPNLLDIPLSERLTSVANLGWRFGLPGSAELLAAGCRPLRLMICLEAQQNSNFDICSPIGLRNKLGCEVTDLSLPATASRTP
jgi:hypothetical protein